MQEVVFWDSLFLYVTRYVFVLQLISTDAYLFHNGTVSDSQPMLMRFVTDAYPFRNGTVYILHPMLIRFEMVFSSTARS